MTLPELVAPSWVDLSTWCGRFGLLTFRMPGARDVAHHALVRGDPAGEDTLVRIHSECLTGDVFGSLRCDCGEQRNLAIAEIAGEGCGVLVYLRGHEGRGIGLNAKLRAYALQQRGLDTVDANLALGLPADNRDFTPAAAVLGWLGVRSVRLLTNNPDKAAALRRLGVTCRGVVPMATTVNRYNEFYLRTKRDRLGHDYPTEHTGGVGSSPIG